MFNILSWYKSHFTTFIHCNRSASTIKLSRPLWTRIKRDQRIIESLQPVTTTQAADTITAQDISGFAALFSKLSNPTRYILFVNPVWHLHGVTNPRMIQTVPISISEQGNVGFQTIQPSVEEIATIYGIPADQDKFDIKVRRHLFNGEPYYELLRP